MEKNQLRHVKNQDDRPLEASKWLELPLILSANEMDAFIQSLGSVSLYPISRPLTQLPTKKAFLEEYQGYISAIEKGEKPKPLQAYLLSSTDETLYALELPPDKFLVRAYLPTLFVRPHNFTFSPLDQKFRSKVYGENAITWGYTFAYPQFCIDPTTHGPEKVDDRYVNTSLYKKIQKWTREFTSPTPFVYQDKKINAPIRIGPECLPFIQNHFQLKAQDLHVVA